MPYDIATKDGISIQNIPDDIPMDSPQLKARVAEIRAQRASRQGADSQAPQAQTAPQLTRRQISEKVNQPGNFQPLKALGNIGRNMAGAVEVGAAIGSGIIAEPIAGLAGLAAAVSPLGDTGAGARTVENVRESLTFQPRGESAQTGMSNIAGALERPIEAFQSIENELGDSVLKKTNSPILATTAKLVPTLATELLGVAVAKGITKIGKPSATQVRIGELIERSRPSRELADISDALISPGSTQGRLDAITDIAARSADNHPVITEINNILSSGGSTSDIIDGVFETVNTSKGAADETARFLLNGADKVVNDPIAVAAINQGFDPGVIAAVKGSSAVDQAKFTEMVNILERGKANARVGSEFRPSDVVGDSLLDRFKAVKKINSDAGRRLDGVAKSLKGQSVNFTESISKFADDLEGMGVSIERRGDKFVGNFDGSIIEGLDAPEKAINRIIERLGRGGQSIDAFDVHRMKKFIDENVTFGKTKEGLGGKTEQVLKSLRRELDRSLDANFPEYNAVNTQFSDTISALDNFKAASGSKFDPSSPNADKFVGTLSRRLLSNAQSRVPLIDAAAQLQAVAKKHGARFDDDILTQTMFVDELQSVFGSSAKSSFLGDIEKGVRTATGKRGLVDVGIDAATAAAQKARGINDKNAIKSIRDLLRRNQ